jgi:2-succinyl-5-enolpyruvyl-6-hydroxy-3-cyclohexene-1-carboxylate synthase
VHLNIPWREPLAPRPVEGDVTATSPLALQGRGDRPLTAVTTSRPEPDAALLDELADRVTASPRGVILAGRQLDPGVAEPVAALAAAAGYPILAEPTSQLRRGPHDRSLVISAYDAVARGRPEALEPQLAIRLGDMPTSKPLRQWLSGLDSLRQVVVDPAAGWNEPTRFAETIVRADPSAFARGLAERLAARDTNWCDTWIAAERAVSGAVEAELSRLADLSEPSAWLALGRALRDGEAVLAASSMPVRDLEVFLPPGPERVLFLSNRGASGIDGLVSIAAGIAAGSGRHTWAVLGDLALCHDVNGLAAAREVSQLRFLVLDNDGGGIFHFLPQAELLMEEEFEALLGTPSGIDLPRVAELYGLSWRAPADPRALDEALAGDARVVIVRADRRHNVELHHRLAEAGLAALGSSLGS